MTVTAMVNGLSMTRSVRVYPVICPTTDSLLNLQPFRDHLSEQMDSSFADDPDISHRIERGAFVYDSSGSLLFRRGAHHPDDTPCRNANPRASPEPGRRVTNNHTHPFSIGDTLPDLCKPPGDPRTRQYGWGLGGPSEQDWERALNDSVPFYVIDKDSIYRGDAPTFSDFVEDSMSSSGFRMTNWASKRQSWPRKTSSCSLVP
jgi:hypothetical protein